ncbi:putative kinetoplast-associated protein KAP [Teratosphaeria destructans]|uniref:Kinetoplast-associated protein KAP n=1 Tax=Teratosphaeria destructans TaxID=418781 RepID=A0A9W7W0H8_9PEZI|nr:putative kinetoplast-associated protein KAP [Teratosphaeria destructans]
MKCCAPKCEIPSDRPTVSQDDIEPELPSYDSVVPFDGRSFPQDNKLTQMYADKVSHHQLNEDIAEMQRRYHGCLAREHRRMQVAGLEDLIRRKSQLTAFTEAPKYLVQLCKEVEFFTSAVDREPSSTTNNAHEPFKRLGTADAKLSCSRRHLITIMVSHERNGWNMQPANYSSADIDSKINSAEQGEITRVDHAWQVWLSIPMTGRSKISIWLENHAVEGARSELIHAEQTSKGPSGLGKLLQTLRLKTKTPRQAFLLVYKAATLAEHVIEPVKFKDCVGRVFTLPWEQANTWTKMAILIENAFECFGELGEEIQQKRYDLFNEAGEILLPNTWRVLP